MRATLFFMRFGSLSVLFLGLVFWSCMDAEPIIEPPLGRVVTVNFSLTHENEILIRENPIGQSNGQNEQQGQQGQERMAASANDLCAIAIYCQTEGGSYGRYAYGLFAANAVPPVKLTENQVYKIECSIVKGGATVIGRDNKGRYFEPFIAASSATAVMSDFIASAAAGFGGLFSGVAAIADDSYIGYKRFARPMLDRYCGVVTDFAPSDGVALNLFAKRTIFGIRPIADGLVDGRIEIEIDGAPMITLTPTSTSREYLISLSGNPANIYSVVDDSYSESIRMKVRWVRGNGSIISIGPANGQMIAVQRRYSYPIAIKLSPSTNTTSITLESPTLQLADTLFLDVNI